MASTFASTVDSRPLDTPGVYVGGTVVKAGVASGSLQNVSAVTDKPSGVLTRSPDTQLNDPTFIDHGGIVVSGPATGLAGAAIEVDQDVVITATGTLVPKSGAGYVVGTALMKAASGEYFEMLVNIRKEPA